MLKIYIFLRGNNNLKNIPFSLTFVEGGTIFNSPSGEGGTENLKTLKVI